MHLFETMKQVKSVVVDWRDYYNYVRPHSSLGGIPPSELWE